jgi:hypothetical protein
MTTVVIRLAGFKPFSGDVEVDLGWTFAGEYTTTNEVILTVNSQCFGAQWIPCLVGY